MNIQGEILGNDKDFGSGGFFFVFSIRVRERAMYAISPNMRVTWNDLLSIDYTIKSGKYHQPKRKFRV